MAASVPPHSVGSHLRSRWRTRRGLAPVAGSIGGASVIGSCSVLRKVGRLSPGSPFPGRCGGTGARSGGRDRVGFSGLNADGFIGQPSGFVEWGRFGWALLQLPPEPVEARERAEQEVEGEENVRLSVGPLGQALQEDPAGAEENAD